MSAISPAGLHLAFLDPFNLAQLPFSIIEKMLRVKRMDMIIHGQLAVIRAANLDKVSRVGGTLDIFAPGWRDAVDVNQATAALRAAFIEYWLGTIRSFGSHRAGHTSDRWRKEPTSLLVA